MVWWPPAQWTATSTTTNGGLMLHYYNNLWFYKVVGGMSSYLMIGSQRVSPSEIPSFSDPACLVIGNIFHQLVANVTRDRFKIIIPESARILMWEVPSDQRLVVGRVREARHIFESGPFSDEWKTRDIEIPFVSPGMKRYILVAASGFMTYANNLIPETRTVSLALMIMGDHDREKEWADQLMGSVVMAGLPSLLSPYYDHPWFVTTPVHLDSSLILAGVTRTYDLIPARPRRPAFKVAEHFRVKNNDGEPIPVRRTMPAARCITDRLVVHYEDPPDRQCACGYHASYSAWELYNAYRHRSASDTIVVVTPLGRTLWHCNAWRSESYEVHAVVAPKYLAPFPEMPHHTFRDQIDPSIPIIYTEPCDVPLVAERIADEIEMMETIE